VAELFLKLGVISFGGPAAHISLMRKEVVVRRQWVTEQEFLDLLAGANLIPGPSSTELAILLGYRRAGWLGLLLAGSLFIAPAMLIVLGIAWAYVRYGGTHGAEGLLWGVKPVIIAVILDAVVGLAKTAVKTPLLGAAGVGVFASYLLGANPIALLVAAGLVVLLLTAAPVAGVGAVGVVASSGAGAAVPAVSTMGLFLSFLKYGSLVYGSGYVLMAFMRDDLVSRLGWLSDRQLVDAIAVGQFTPGPVFTTATFIGYLLLGVPGALIATLAVFLPAFLFVPLVYPLIPRLRASRRAGAFLDGVNVAGVGLMAAVCVQLAGAALPDAPAVLVFLGAGLALWRLDPNPAWLIAGGAVLGVLRRLLFP
jgi:chromate transporter